MRKLSIIALGLSAVLWALASPIAQSPQPGRREPSIRFAVIGDNGTGEKPQYDVANQMAMLHESSPFDLVLMLGDNMYGAQKAQQDFDMKFERPYGALLKVGVMFFATLGNHDRQENRFYKGFNMAGQRYYTYERAGVRFFVLDTNLMDGPQLQWFEDQLKKSNESWKIVYFHHPLYSDAGRHGPDVQLRVLLEPLLVRYGVDVVFSGHEHVYERLTPQKGVTYFIVGNSGKLSKGDIVRSATTAAAFDQDQAFLFAEIGGDEMSFVTISRTGQTVDRGVVRARPPS